MLSESNKVSYRATPNTLSKPLTSLHTTYTTFATRLQLQKAQQRLTHTSGHKSKQNWIQTQHGLSTGVNISLAVFSRCITYKERTTLCTIPVLTTNCLTPITDYGHLTRSHASGWQVVCCCQSSGVECAARTIAFGGQLYVL